MGVSLALKKEGVGLQPESVQALSVRALKGPANILARDALPNREHITFLVDLEAERYTSRHLQIYLSM